MDFSPLIQQLINSLNVLPGVGPKTAQRMAFHILERDPQGGLHLADRLTKALESIDRCQRCRILCEMEICGLCQDKARDPKLLCVVQSPSDVLALEHAGGYRGYYFVLTGHLSPIDGIGPEDIGIPQLEQRLKEDELKEVILATNATVEGEATAFYISQMAKQFNLKTTRIAQGVPLGGELEYVDGNTLSRALVERNEV